MGGRLRLGLLALGLAGPAWADAPGGLPPFVTAGLTEDGTLAAEATDSGTYVLQALGQGDWYRRLLAYPPPHSVAISTGTLRVAGTWGARGTPGEAIRACGGAATGCRVYLDRDRVVWRPDPADPVPAALVPEPGAGADTATLAGALQGAAAERGGCETEPGRVWAEAAGREACLRYRLGGGEGKGDAAGAPAGGLPVLLLLDGDEVYPLYARGRPAVTGVAAIAALSAKRDALVERRLAAAAAGAGLRYLLLQRPGTGGSTGSQWRDGKTVRETALVGAALDRLARRHGIARWAIAGQSGGASLAANLLAGRRDVACAALASGPLALALQLAAQGADPALLGELDDPLRRVADLVPDPGRRVLVLSDAADELVPLPVQAGWVEAARGRGIAVEHLVRGRWAAGPLHHDLTWPAVAAAAACAAGRDPGAAAAAAADAAADATSG